MLGSSNFLSGMAERYPSFMLARDSNASTSLREEEILAETPSDDGISFTTIVRTTPRYVSW
jgi:hypothetical protein